MKDPHVSRYLGFSTPLHQSGADLAMALLTCPLWQQQEFEPNVDTLAVILTLAYHSNPIKRREVLSRVTEIAQHSKLHLSGATSAIHHDDPMRYVRYWLDV